jgi:tellurite resistance protein TerC
LNLWLWAILSCVIAALAVVEFALLARRPRVVAPAEALAGTGLWVVVAGFFGWLIYIVYRNNWLGIQTELSHPLDNVAVDGGTAVVQFITVYIAELALSLDNIAVLSLLLVFYRVPAVLVGRVLYWAVTAAMVLRLLMIFAVGPLSVSFDWFHYVFAGLLLVAVVRTLLIPDSATDVARGWIPRFIKAFVPVTEGPDRRDNARLTTLIKDPATGKRKLAITSLMAVVLVVAIADITYAADFLPAAYSITQDPLIAAAGNAFALLTLRSLFFTIAPFMGRFRYLKLSLVFIMLYIAFNTVVYHDAKVPADTTLGVVTGVLLLGVLASVLVNKRKGLPTLPIGSIIDPAPAPLDELTTIAADLRPAPIDDLVEAAATTKRNFRKVCILIAGTAVIIFGIIIAPLPGPGPTILVPIGIAILATEFIWAKRLLDNLKHHGDRLARTTDRLSAGIPGWVVIMAAVLWPCIWGGLWWLLKSHDHARLATLAMASGFGCTFPFAIWVWRRLRKKS